MRLRSAAGTAAFNIAVSLALLVVGIGGGAAVGLVKGSGGESPPVTDATSRIAAFAPTEQSFAGGLTVQEAPPAPVAVRRTVRRVVTVAARSGSASARVAPSLTAPITANASGGGSQVACGARLDNAKINWLLELVAKAKSSNPDQTAVADRVDSQLRGALGKNMCAQEAQLHISNMCGDASTRRFMGLMVKELPFFVRPMVGDPCTQDLVAAAEKWLP